MFNGFIKRNILPRTPGGWSDIKKKLVEDVSPNNSIDIATRVLASFVFNPNLSDMLETNLIHSLSEYIDDVNELMVAVFVTAKMYGSCMQNENLLFGLHEFGIQAMLTMKYSASDYFYSNIKGMFVLDYDGKLRMQHTKQLQAFLQRLVVKDDTKNIDLNDIPPGLTDKEADDIIDKWKSTNKNNDTSN